MTTTRFKAKYLLANLTFVALCLFAIGCVDFRVSHVVHLDQIYKIPAFIDHHWFLKPDVYIYMTRAGNGDYWVLNITSADELQLGFAEHLHEGESYNFPQAFTDYANSQQTKP